MELELERYYYPEGTNGILRYGGLKVCYTIELPWKGNERNVSCIPEGRYALAKRYSERFKWHIEIRDVAGRSDILFHPANYALRELRGCIAPVSELSGAGKGSGSLKAFGLLKRLVYKRINAKEDVFLIIKCGTHGKYEYH